MIYLDYAAATPVDERVLADMQPYWAEQFYNPSATYLAGKQVAHNLQAARSRVSTLLGAKPSEIIFTAGGTEADNLAVNGVMQAFPDAKLLVSAVEHDAVLKTAQNYPHEQIGVESDGTIDMKRLEKLIDAKVVLISVMYANNEVGTIQPIKQIAQLVKQERLRRRKDGNDLPLYLHTDASQAANYLDLHVSRLGVDLMTLNGGKIYGPKQTGALYIKSGVELKAQILGGGQERGLRNGTENVAGSIGFASALQIASDLRLAETKRLQALQEYFANQLQAAIPEIVINGGSRRLPNNVHLTIPGTDNERLMMQLDEQGIVCAVGSACSASSDEPSHVLKALGLSDAQAQSSLRFTMGRDTTKQQLDTTINALQKIHDQ